MIVFLNGNYLPADEARISLFDGGYLYGDGMFETVRLYAGRPFDLDGHLARLAGNVAALDYAWRPEPAVFAEVIAELARRNGLAGADARCRITVSRGGSHHDPLPLDRHAELSPTVSVYVVPLDPALARWQSEGVGVLTMSAGFSRGAFPQLKTLNYLTTVTALRLAHADGCHEALLLDADGQVLEGATSNIFLVRDGGLATPPLELGLLAGRTRGILLAAAAEAGLPSREVPFTPAEITAADEAFLCGSVKEIVPIVQVDGKSVGDGTLGPVTRRLQKDYRRDVLDALGG